jgi:plasmid rolling circle replication initiator protein Rep
VPPKIRSYNLNAVEFDLPLEIFIPYLRFNILGFCVQITISKLYLVSTIFKYSLYCPTCNHKIEIGTQLKCGKLTIASVTYKGLVPTSERIHTLFILN